MSVARTAASPAGDRHRNAGTIARISLLTLAPAWALRPRPPQCPWPSAPGCAAPPARGRTARRARPAGPAGRRRSGGVRRRPQPARCEGDARVAGVRPKQQGTEAPALSTASQAAPLTHRAPCHRRSPGGSRRSSAGGCWQSGRPAQCPPPPAVVGRAGDSSVCGSAACDSRISLGATAQTAAHYYLRALAAGRGWRPKGGKGGQPVGVIHGRRPCSRAQHLPLAASERQPGPADAESVGEQLQECRQPGLQRAAAAGGAAAGIGGAQRLRFGVRWLGERMRSCTHWARRGREQQPPSQARLDAVALVGRRRLWLSTSARLAQPRRRGLQHVQLCVGGRLVDGRRHAARRLRESGWGGGGAAGWEDGRQRLPLPARRCRRPLPTWDTAREEAQPMVCALAGFAEKEVRPYSGRRLPAPWTCSLGRCSQKTGVEHCQDRT